MPKSSANKGKGKQGKLGAIAYLCDNGYSCPIEIELKRIAEIYLNNKKIIKTDGFDVIKIDDREKLEKGNPITLYQVTSCNESSGLKISKGFRGHGFTVTSAAKSNADALGEQFKYIFVNMATKNILETNLHDFFNNKEYASTKRNITWAIHIKK